MAHSPALYVRFLSLFLPLFVFQSPARRLRGLYADETCDCSLSHLTGNHNPSSGMLLARCVSVASVHPSRTCTSGSLDSVIESAHTYTDWVWVYSSCPKDCLVGLEVSVYLKRGGLGLTSAVPLGLFPD